MSKSIRYDALLARDLADTLDARLRGRRCYGISFDRERLTFTAALEQATLVWNLHPAQGHVRLLEHRAVDANVLLPQRALIASIRAVPDERIVHVEIEGADAGEHGGLARCIVVELLTNQWNAIALGTDARIVHILRPRESGDRTLRTGDVYKPPEPAARTRPHTLDEWRRLLAQADDVRRAFLQNVAGSSPLNAPYILDGTLDTGFERYEDVVSGPRTPCLLGAPLRDQPYAHRLGTQARAFDDLLSAFAAADPAVPEGADEDARRTALERAQLLAKKAAGRARKLRSELERAPAEAQALRRHADLLLSQVHRIEKGAQRVDLDDYEGGSISLDLDATLTPAENAQLLYVAARKRERAAAQLPGLIAAAEKEADEFATLAHRIETNAATELEIRSLQPRAVEQERAEAIALPYHRFRTPSGLEVRVGKGAKHNDNLTFHHSSPNDIWLHARDVGGAHVVLRWTDAVANPAEGDLRAAANLAALFSKARTSGMVPVDWTRRKYVRKPRKSPPGRVVIERAKTVFVEPDADQGEAMRC